MTKPKPLPIGTRLKSLNPNIGMGRLGTLGGWSWFGIRWVTLDPDPQDPDNPWQALRILYHPEQWEEIKEPHA